MTSGDAYEYLMRHFATESGKARGNSTPGGSEPGHGASSVSIGPTTAETTVYDLPAVPARCC